MIRELVDLGARQVLGLVIVGVAIGVAFGVGLTVLYTGGLP